jgi:DNA-binding NtrC family response regulator
MKLSGPAIVFVLDSNIVYQRIIAQYLQVAGVDSVITFSNPDKMYPSLKLHPSIIISEYIFEKNALRGRQVLAKVKQECPSTDFYFHTSLRDVNAAVNAIQGGAIDYIIKSTSAVDELVRKIMKRLQLKNSLDKSKKNLKLFKSYLGLVLVVLIGLMLYYSLF